MNLLAVTAWCYELSSVSLQWLLFLFCQAMMVLFLVATHLITNSSSHTNWTAGRFSPCSSVLQGPLVLNMLAFFIPLLRASCSSGFPHPSRCARHFSPSHHLHPPHSLPAQVRHTHTSIVIYVARFIMDDVKVNAYQLKIKTYIWYDTNMHSEC